MEKRRLSIYQIFFIPFIIGIFFASYISPLGNLRRFNIFRSLFKILEDPISPKMLFFLLVLIFLGIIFYYSIPRKNYFLLLTIISLSFYIGTARFHNTILDPTDNSNINYYHNKSLRLKAEVIKVNDQKNFKTIIADNLKSEGKTLRGKIKLVTNLGNRIEPGYLIEVNNQLEPIKNFSTEFNYIEYLEKDGIYGQIFLPQIYTVGKTNSYKYRLEKLAGQLKIKIEKILTMRIPDQNVSALSSAMILGNKENLDTSIVENFQKTNMSHILAISGLHLSIISLGLFFILKDKFNLSIDPSIIITITITLLYLSLIEFPASAVRASIMIFHYLIAKKLGKIYFFQDSLIVAAFIMLAFDPKLLKYDLGFQLSFLALIGISSLSPILMTAYLNLKNFFDKEKISLPSIHQRKFKRKIKPSFLSRITFVSLSAQLGTLPLTIPKFGIISFFSPLTNILILPFVPLFIVLSILVPIISLFSVTGAYLLGHSARLIGLWIISTIEIVQKIPGSYISF